MAKACSTALTFTARLGHQVRWHLGLLEQAQRWGAVPGVLPAQALYRMQLPVGSRAGEEVRHQRSRLHSKEHVRSAPMLPRRGVSDATAQGDAEHPMDRQRSKKYQQHKPSKACATQNFSQSLGFNNAPPPGESSTHVSPSQRHWHWEHACMQQHGHTGGLLRRRQAAPGCRQHRHPARATSASARPLGRPARPRWPAAAVPAPCA